jgi:hypothetical protein
MTRGGQSKFYSRKENNDKPNSTSAHSPDKDPLVIKASDERATNFQPDKTSKRDDYYFFKVLYMVNDDDDNCEFPPMPSLPLVANRDEHQWGESFSPLSSFGYLEQEGGEDEDEHTLKNDDDGEDDDIGVTSNHSRNSLHAFIEADGDVVEVVNAILEEHPFKATKPPI